MINRYLVVSDLHLCDVEDHPDGWKAYKSSRYLFDDEFAKLLVHFTKEHEDSPGPLTLILNGDIFDFDLVTAVPDNPPWPVSPEERQRGLHPTESKSIWKLQWILAHHWSFLINLAKFLLEGNRLVYVLGNHDREFHFKGVQQAFVKTLRELAKELGGQFDDQAIQFEPWFFVVKGEIYVEHGQQYDHYTSYQNVLDPTVRPHKRASIALPMGNLSNRVLMNRMGHFNPHASDYILNVFRYITHWWRYYALTRRSLVWRWFWGSVVVLLSLWRNRRFFRPRPAKRFRAELEAQAKRYSISFETVTALYKLQKAPITKRLFLILREFWLDRLLLALVFVLVALTLWGSSVATWAKVMVPLAVFPLLYLGYEYLLRGETIFSVETRLPKVARAIADIVPVRVVVFGHTHLPRMIPLSKHLDFVDTGTWAPIWTIRQPRVLAPGYRNYLYLSFQSRQTHLQFGSWLEDSGLDGKLYQDEEPFDGATLALLERLISEADE